MTHPDDIPQPPISPPEQPQRYYYLECDSCPKRWHEDDAEPGDECDKCGGEIMLIEDDEPWEDDDRYG